MAKLILKSPYIKSSGGAGGYLQYIATRERVELIPDDRPPTRKQEQLITKLVNDFPDTKTLYEYEDYVQDPTKVNASAFITLALESNWDAIRQSNQYMKYIATRPRAERLGSHGLFGDEDHVDLNKAIEELQRYTGNVWTHIISLKREDTARLGYDNAAAWRDLLRTHRNDIAAAMKIQPNDFRWYAAFHDEGEHPHVHMMAWSTKPGQAYLSRAGIEQIKSKLTNDIFKQEMLHLYEQKAQSRDELVHESRKAMQELTETMRTRICNHPEAEILMWELSKQLKTVIHPRNTEQDHPFRCGQPLQQTVPAVIVFILFYHWTQRFQNLLHSLMEFRLTGILLLHPGKDLVNICHIDYLQSIITISVAKQQKNCKYQRQQMQVFFHNPSCSPFTITILEEKLLVLKSRSG